MERILKGFLKISWRKDTIGTLYILGWSKPPYFYFSHRKNIFFCNFKYDFYLFRYQGKLVIFSVFSILEKICYCPRFLHLYRYYFLGDLPILPVYGSIESLWPQGMNHARNLFRPVLDLVGGAWSSISFVFYMKIRFYLFLRRVMSLMLDREGRVKSERGQKGAGKIGGTE